MSSRYTGRRKVVNDSEIYEERFKERDVLFIKQFKTPRMKHPSASQRASLARYRHTWKLGDRYWKLAAEHYGNSKLWWVIGWYNQRPVESMLNPGDTIIIPKPLERVLSFVRYY